MKLWLWRTVLVVLAVGLSLIGTKAWNAVVVWIDPAPHNLQLVKLPGIMISIAVGFIVGKFWNRKLNSMIGPRSETFREEYHA